MITTEELREVLDGLDGVETSHLEPDADFEDQDMDSLDVIQTLFHIQEHYDVTISDQEVEDRKWSSIEKIVTELNILGK